MEQHADCLQKHFDKCMKFGIFINIAKSAFLVPFEKLVGHIVFERGIAIDLDKVSMMIALPIPTIVTKVKRILGHTGYYGGFIFKFATIVMYLTKSLEKYIYPQYGP